MKLIIKLFLLSTFIVGNLFNAYSQETKTDETIEQIQQVGPETIEEVTDTRTYEEKAEEAEVRKFLDSFLKEMDDKKDINKVSDKFFSDNFKERFAKKSNLFIIFSEDIYEKLTEDEQQQGNAEVFNLIYLAKASMYGSGVDFDSESLDTFDGIKKIFPQSAIEIATSNRFLNSIITKEFGPKNNAEDVPEPEIENVIELKELIGVFHNINEEMRKCIEAKPTSWHETRIKKAQEMTKGSDYYHETPCNGDDCKGLKENQIIYHIDNLPFCILLVNEFGNYKIINIYIRMD